MCVSSSVLHGCMCLQVIVFVASMPHEAGRVRDLRDAPRLEAVLWHPDEADHSALRHNVVKDIAPLVPGASACLFSCSVVHASCRHASWPGLLSHPMLDMRALHRTSCSHGRGRRKPVSDCGSGVPGCAGLVHPLGPDRLQRGALVAHGCAAPQGARHRCGPLACTGVLGRQLLEVLCMQGCMCLHSHGEQAGSLDCCGGMVCAAACRIILCQGPP